MILPMRGLTFLKKSLIRMELMRKENPYLRAIVNGPTRRAAFKFGRFGLPVLASRPRTALEDNCLHVFVLRDPFVHARRHPQVLRPVKVIVRILRTIERPCAVVQFIYKEGNQKR
jgi:hypothetical protein